MSTKRQTKLAQEAVRWYRGADIPMTVIRDFARQVAERFHPEKIILFGSYAYGTPHVDSDVDILVVMPARNQLDQAVRIERIHAIIKVGASDRSPRLCRPWSAR